MIRKKFPSDKICQCECGKIWQGKGMECRYDIDGFFLTFTNTLTYSILKKTGI